VSVKIHELVGHWIILFSHFVALQKNLIAQSNTITIMIHW